MHRAPDLTLVLRDFGFISVLNSDATLKRRKKPKGLHRPDGIFMAAGPAVRRGAAIGRLSIMDVCPALLHSLDLPIPVGLEGRLPVEVLAPSSSELYRVLAYARSVPAELDTSDEAGFTSAEEDAVLSRLRGLGYIE
jgi:hypothetical protein